MTRIRVTATSRIHFGLLRLQESARPSFGGVGMMVDSPRWEFVLEDGCAGEITAADPTPLLKLTKRLADVWSLPHPLPCRITLLQHAPSHVGLGTGTQRNLALLAGLAHLFQRAPLSTEQLAKLAGRGRRSAVGTHGFEQGGLIVDGGYLPHQTLGELVARREVPREWRVILTWPPDDQGLSGDQEQQAFDQFASGDESLAAHMTDLIHDRMLPALDAADCDAFGEAVYEYGTASGQYFIASQGGIFASQLVSDTVAQLRAWGVAGTGQSSWGPAVYGILPDAARAEEIRRQLLTTHPLWTTIVAQPMNDGAQVETSAH